MSVIEVEGVSKRFPGSARPAVDDCSLRVASGELTVLLGPSGSGKTTLLKLVNRLYEPDSGRILIDGVDVRTLRASDLRRGIGYVIQQVGLFPHLRVEQNIATVPQLLGWPRERIEARIDDLLDLVGLPRDYRRRYPRQLSGGEQQRVGLARALAADPKIMLMDEPFGALDAITRARLQDEFRVIQQRLHKTILFVTHDVDEALRLADRIAIMRQGRIVQFDTPLAIISRPRDQFVRQLLTSDDVLRHLSLIPVRAALGAPDRPPAHPGAGSRSGSASVRAADSLRTALSLLLQSGEAALTVVGDGGVPVGRLTFEDIRGAVLAGRAEASC
ncbi:MAG: ABC transporter ATP-binding protein [Armatimonadota bacterium]|nr:ABC transporter ATP-binding protein [Armatimonadota bacterium]